MKIIDIQQNMICIDKLKSQLKEINITLISNIYLEPYFKLFIKKKFASWNFYANVLHIKYEEYKAEYNIKNFQNAHLLIILVNIDSLVPDFTNNTYYEMQKNLYNSSHVEQACDELYKYSRICSQAPIFWFGLEDYYNNIYKVKGNIQIIGNYIDRVNDKMANKLDSSDVFIDLKHLIANVGISNSYSQKGRYRWNSPYSNELVSEIADEIIKQYLIQIGMTKKCIICDCDNVLWGGILSEVGIENINIGSSGLGRSYQDFQRFLLNLYYHGVILAICSKNNITDVIKVLNEHNEMILKEEHISCFQVNWDNKVDNIKNISETLNIGLDSIVFIDDSYFEIESVKSLLPEVTTILYNRDTVYEKLSCFNLKNKVNIISIKERNNTYKTNNKREMLKLNCKDYQDYLSSLNIKIDIHEATLIEYNRIAELSQRTNKCTNGKRYTVFELKEKIKTGSYKLFAVYVSDRFSDLGLVGALGIVDSTLDLFCLSCRALGREIEDEMIKYISQYKVLNLEISSLNKNNLIKKSTKELI